MGVGFAVDGNLSGAHWSYSGFNEFRHRLAEAAGINLKKMEGFVELDKAAIINEKGWEAYREAVKEEFARGKIPWSTIDDPLKPFLNHSDCEGELTPAECATVGPRIKELVSQWPDKITLEINPEFRKQRPEYPERMEMDNYDKVHALLLVKAMEEAVRLNLPLEFC